MLDNKKDDENVYLLNVARGSDFNAKAYFRTATNWRCVDANSHQLTYVKVCKAGIVAKDFALFKKQSGEGNILIYKWLIFCF
jgi:hypothetical protein